GGRDRSGGRAEGLEGALLGCQLVALPLGHVRPRVALAEEGSPGIAARKGKNVRPQWDGPHAQPHEGARRSPVAERTADGDWDRSCEPGRAGCKARGTTAEGSEPQSAAGDQPMLLVKGSSADE